MRTSALLLVVVCASSSTAAAQGRWEIEVYGGAVVSRAASDGKQTLPPAGAPIVTSSPLFPSRQVPSWFFGDGAALLNGVSEEFQGTSRIAPLDPLFARAAGGATGAAGARVRRALSDRTTMEVGVDFLGSAAVAPSDFAATVEAARRSFGETFSELLRSGPFTSLAVEATADVTGAKRREIAATVALNSDLGTLGPMTPYLTFGGGIVTGSGAEPAAQLAGRYRFAVLGQVPIDESDRVTVHFERPIALAFVIGGGLRKDVTDRWAVRFDVRALIGPDSTRVRVTADPAVARGTPGGFVESFTNPSIQFSNDPSLGRRSSLNDTPLDSIVFEGGIQARTMVTFGVSRRF